MPDFDTRRLSLADFVGERAGDATQAALAGLGAIYEAANAQVAKVPGTSRLAALGKRGSEELHAWANAPASRDVQKSRATFAKLFDFAVPQDELGMLLAGIPPARFGKSAREFRYWHGTTPERAKRILAGEGFASGQSALLGVEGTSLSRDPNVSLHRFAHGDPAGLLAVDVPEHLRSQIHNMTLQDFFGTKELLAAPDAPGIYNKPSTTYKELETFVRRAHPVDEGGQLGLFRPTDELRARRPTEDELRYAQNVHFAAQHAYDLKDYNVNRAAAVYAPGSAPELGKLHKEGLPAPREVISSFRQLTGSGSNTERAKATRFLSDSLRGLKLGVTRFFRWEGSHMTAVPHISVETDFLYQTASDPRGRRPTFHFSAVLENGRPVAKYTGVGDPPTNFADYRKRLDRWWESTSDATKRSFRQWDTPRGHALINAVDEDMSHSEIIQAKDKTRAAVQLSRTQEFMRQQGHNADEIQLTWLKSYRENEPSGYIRATVPAPAGEENTVYFGGLRERDVPSLVRLDDNTVQVNTDELRSALLRQAHSNLKAGVAAREALIKKVEELAP